MIARTGIVFFPAFDWSISPTHPEREERLLYTRDQLFEEGIMDLDEIREYKPRLAELKDIARTHFCIPNIKEQTLEAHQIAAGGALVLADALVAGEIKNGFALVRPPGHHAMRVVHGNRGFCNINNEAIMVDYLRKKHGFNKIAIVDTDVHHGDGTQDIFYHDPNVLFISFHQDGRTLYPGTGFLDELGGPNAFAKTINIPLPPGTGDKGIHYVLDELIIPILQDFQPELIINSAGQDNHFSDPLASMKLTAQGYAELTKKLKADLAVLEGGYAIESALPYINMAVTLAMAGLDYSYVREPDCFSARNREANNLEEIKELVGQIQHVWAQSKDVDLDKMFNKKNFFQRKKHIFYDTNYFNENQLETIKKCYECSGYVTIESYTNTTWGREGAYCISIPIDACPNCHDEAMMVFEEKHNTASQSLIILQDKKFDCYKTFNRKTKTEIDVK